ncbi:MAG: ATP-binding protein, partial [Proteobacteria bacterium]|nr:ATP-binding protein [Pseudomonadota bacterium]
CKMIIENLMKFSRQEKMQFVEEDISSMVRAGIDLVDHQLTIGGVKIEKDIPDGFPKIMCSTNQIQQVLMNIMLNAQHAMENSSQKKLTVRVKQGRTGYARIEIEDTGTGMSEDVKKRIFEPFFTTKPSGKGTGLGLSVSYGIVKDHKGILDVKSKEGEGTIFSIDLPYKDPEMVVDVNRLTEHKDEKSTSLLRPQSVVLPPPPPQEAPQSLIIPPPPQGSPQSLIIPPPPQGSTQSFVIPPPPSQESAQLFVIPPPPPQELQAQALPQQSSEQQIPIMRAQYPTPPKLKSKISGVLESKLESAPKSDKKSIGPINVPRPQRRG